MKSWHTLFKYPEDRSLEENIFIKMTLISLLSAVLFMLNAIIVLQDWPVIIVDSIAVIFLAVTYYLSLKPGAYKRLYLPFGLFLLIIINSVWFVSGGYDSPNGYILMIIVMVLIFVSKRKILPWIVVLFLLDIIILFGIEYYNPDIVIEYPKQSDIISQGIVFIVCTLLMGYIILIVRQHYDRARDKTQRINRELAGKNLQIAERNIKLKEQGDLLEEKNRKITEQNDILQNYSYKLEQQVGERTAQLETLNKDLLDQNLKLEHFTFILAHNLKSPVAQLMGLTDLLKKTVQMDGLAQETIDKISDSSQSLHEIINDLNQILHIRRGNDAYFEEVDLNDILRKVLYTLETDIRLKHAEIKIRADKEIAIRGVKAYFQSIFYNLISNALKYTEPEKKPVIHINIRKSSEEVVMSINDNGVGIDLESAGDKLFQLYQRFHSGYQGKGFGLFLTKTQVEAMGGTIEVDSVVGQGTTFKIVFSRID